MNLILDIGNTCMKMAVFKQEQLQSLKIVENDKENIEKHITQIRKEYLQIKKIIICSTIHFPTIILDTLALSCEKVIFLDQKTLLPFENLYGTKTTLGTDRLAAAAGALFLHPQQELLIIDMGTAITIDRANAKNQFLGGNISPGLALRYKALHQFTDKLPLIQPSDTWNLMGTNTQTAIMNGVQNSILFEIETYITTYSNTNPELVTLITGGDLFFFEKKLKSSIFAQPNLVLIGLNQILEYNARN